MGGLWGNNLGKGNNPAAREFIELTSPRTKALNRNPGIGRTRDMQRRISPDANF